jgi:hypothetical protein
MGWWDGRAAARGKARVAACRAIVVRSVLADAEDQNRSGPRATGERPYFAWLLRGDLTGQLSNLPADRKEIHRFGDHRTDSPQIVSDLEQAGYRTKTRINVRAPRRPSITVAQLLRLLLQAVDQQPLT